jgi:hypothetical protein
METSGYDIVVFSDADASTVMASLGAAIKAHWGRLMNEAELQAETDRTGRENREFFFCRDTKMRRLHDRVGYNLDEEGQGCFMLMAGAPDFSMADITVEREETASPFKREPYRASLCCTHLLQYTLVTPAQPDKDRFSAFVLDSLRKALGHPPSLEERHSWT